MAQANVLQSSVSGGTSNALALQGDGIFLPKINAVSRLALTMTSADVGFQVYDTTDNNIYLWTGLAWESVVFSGDTSTTQILFNNNGVVSGSSDLTFNPTAASPFTVVGNATIGGLNIGTGFGGTVSNTCVGNGALSSLTAGVLNNTAFGYESQQRNFNGSGNTSFGSRTFNGFAFSGSDNIALGYLAGSTLLSGSSNIIIGRSAVTESATSSNQICFGSTSYWVGTNGGPTVWWAGASGAIGYWRVIINGTAVKIPIYAD